MKIELGGGLYPTVVKIIREECDQKVYRESLFWYKVRNALKDLGFDVIKKKMVTDGHLTSDTQYYVRARDYSFCLYDDRYQVRFVYTDFNQEGWVEVDLQLSLDVDRDTVYTALHKKLSSRTLNNDTRGK